MATPHNSAEKGAFAKTVLMPGDPLRAKYIAEHYLENPVLINNVRGIHGYTGTYRGVPVSVMASGMGIPSIGIYSYELFHFYDVDNIIRVGTAGGLHPQLQLRDVVIGMGACTNSNYGAQFQLPGTFAPICSYPLLESAMRHGRDMGLRMQVGNLLSSDTFYSALDDPNGKWMEMGVLAVEMEAAGLYMNAAKAGKNALTICTISDHIVRGEALDAEARQSSFTDMMELALAVAVDMAEKE